MFVCSFVEMRNKKSLNTLLISYCLLVVVFGRIFHGINANSVVDADGSILNEISANPSRGYLIKFHAPWCGHCRHFEPIYESIAKEVEELSLTDDDLKNIRVVRIDATVYSNVANYYDIHGFPTVKFIRGSQIISYENERTKSAVMDFLRRVNGPSIRWIESVDQFNDIRREHDVFFLYLTTLNTNENETLFQDYQQAVNRYLSQAYFYATNSSVIQQTFFPTYQTEILAVKNDGFYLYKNSNDTSLDDFILKEKITTYPQIASGNMYDLILTKKIIVIFGFDEKTNRDEIKSQILNYVNKHSNELHETFQFAWTNDLDLLNNIAVWTLQEPLFLLYDSNQRKYGVIPLTSIDNIDGILDTIIRDYSKIIKHTSNSWQKRLFRPFWELSRIFSAMFIEAPLLSMLIIGLPSAVLSIVCYCLCCLPNESLYNEQEEILEDKLDEQEKPSVEKKDD